MTNYDILKEYEAHQTPVPSYEEWKRIFHYASKYEHEYTSCAMDYENLKQENAQLKDLLKRARGLMNYTKDWACSDAIEEMIAKIDEALQWKEFGNQ